MGILPHRQTPLQISFNLQVVNKKSHFMGVYCFLISVICMIIHCYLLMIDLLYVVWNIFVYFGFFEWNQKKIKQETEGTMRYFLCKNFTFIDSKKFSSTWTKYHTFRPFTRTADYPHRSIFAIKRKKFQQITCSGR